MEHEPRTYRRSVEPAGLVTFEVSVGETDLSIAANTMLTDEAEALVRDVRRQIETYIASHPRFADSFAPISAEAGAPPAVIAMVKAGEAAGVGPMAAVAGVIAEHVARGLAEHSPEVIVENGGDIYIVGAVERTVAIWAGVEGAAGLGLLLPAEALPCAICASSGRIGHSWSFGDADVAVVLARDGALADACATSLANHVRGIADLRDAVRDMAETPGVAGAVASIDGAVGAAGDVQLVPIARGASTSVDGG